MEESPEEENRYNIFKICFLRSNVFAHLEQVSSIFFQKKTDLIAVVSELPNRSQASHRGDQRDVSIFFFSLGNKKINSIN